MPRGIKPEPNEGNTSALTAAPQADDLVKLGKRQAWAKFLAYEASSAVLHAVLNTMCYLASNHQNDEAHTGGAAESNCVLCKSA